MKGFEDRIRKWCPHILSFFQRQRKTLLKYVAVDWQSNLVETDWTNFGRYESKKRGVLGIEIDENRLIFSRSDNEGIGSNIGLGKDFATQLFVI